MSKSPMHYRRCVSFIIYLFAFVGLLSVSQYVLQYRERFLSIVVNQNLRQRWPFPSRQTNLSDLNPLLKHIERCPECVLFTLTKSLSSIENETILTTLNQISTSSQAIFYPRTMKLFYNQPIPYHTILSSNTAETTSRLRRSWTDSIEKLDHINTDSILSYILQSLRKPIEETNYFWPNKTKLILYYTKFFGNAYWYNKDEKQVYSNDFHFDNCPLTVNACHITIDQNLFAQSDASLIHLRESIDYKKLNTLPRRSDQRFVFFLKESPVHSPTFSSKAHGHLFNYTQTYRPDSDITATTLRDFFWLFDEKVHPNYDFQSILDSKQTGKLLVAVISNCGGSSNRLKYINELKEHISIDVFGKCGKTCPAATDCRQFTYSTYKFYLAFENSLCEEYVTEKFFFALQSARIIPVVMGWARYEHYIPASGYIDVRNFSSPRELAKYIDYLDRNSTAYLEYFQWRQYALHIKPPHYMCELCLKLFLDDRDHRQQSLEKIDQYWNSKSQCHRYTKTSQGIWIME